MLTVVSTACAGTQVRDMGGEATRGDVLETLAARRPASVFAGEASIKVDTVAGKQNATLHFLVSPALTFRGDLTTVFGIPLASLVVTGSEIAYHEVGRNRFVMGNVVDARGLLLIPLDPGEFLSVVTGVPPIERYDAARTRVVERKDALLIQMAGEADNALAMRVDRRGGLVREMIFMPAGVKVLFEKYRSTSNGPMPEAVRIVNPENDTEATVKLGGWDFAPDVQPGAFVLEPPPGTQQFRIMPKPQGDASR